MRKVIIPLVVVLAVFILSGAAICEEPQDISWLDGTVWEKTSEPYLGSKIKITMENGVGIGVLVDEDRKKIKWRKIQVDKKNRIAMEGSFYRSDGIEFWVNLGVEFKDNGKVMVITPKEYGPYRKPLERYEMKLVEE